MTTTISYLLQKSIATSRTADYTYIKIKATHPLTPKVCDVIRYSMPSGVRIIQFDQKNQSFDVRIPDSLIHQLENLVPAVDLSSLSRWD